MGHPLFGNVSGEAATGSAEKQPFKE